MLMAWPPPGQELAMFGRYYQLRWVSEVDTVASVSRSAARVAGKRKLTYLRVCAGIRSASALLHLRTRRLIGWIRMVWSGLG